VFSTRIPQQAVSFTDCIVMALANEYETRTIFGSDDGHARVGYRIIGNEEGSEAA
jgi:predicted nucleic acid-binding protein